MSGTDEFGGLGFSMTRWEEVAGVRSHGSNDRHNPLSPRDPIDSDFWFWVMRQRHLFVSRHLHRGFGE
ncbi:hypothetical protein RISK_005616 [Rhodopirellula islandica]|uniref:Uncharacterized protein n=1 Tax=Rhodopirellula islandica TaxID=595434 RepID=A0A0J1B6U9_RHOIS|nr:hypothetical protein RISK_005616 [Rhodopirellula islandica]